MNAGTRKAGPRSSRPGVLVALGIQVGVVPGWGQVRARGWPLWLNAFVLAGRRPDRKALEPFLEGEVTKERPLAASVLC